MGAIERRVSSKGNISYRAKVRITGLPEASATFDRKTDAKDWISQTEAAMKEGRYFPQSKARKHTVADLIDKYMSHVGADNPKRLESIKHHLEWWKKELGDYSLADLNKERLLDARTSLQNKERWDTVAGIEAGGVLTNATINRYWVSFHTALNMAVQEWEWIQKNPMSHIKKLKEGAGRDRFLSKEETKKLLAATRQSESEYLHAIVLVALCTGARKSNILNLKWEDIDFDRDRITLHETKNGEKKTLYMHSKLKEELQRLHAQKRDNEYVFQSPHSNKPQHIDKPWRVALVEAKITNFKFHDLRHTTASNLAMNGASLAEIAEVLGHKTLSMVQRYTHLTESHTTSVVNNMNDKLFEAAE